MKLHVTIEGRDEALSVELIRDQGDTALVRINGEERTVVLSGRDATIVGEDGRYEVIDAAGSAIASVLDERDTWLGAGAGADASGSVTVAMPGRVVAVLVEPGQEVARGDRLVVIEAMKMENDVKAPRDGGVKSVLVSPGGSVEAGEPLVELE